MKTVYKDEKLTGMRLSLLGSFEIVNVNRAHSNKLMINIFLNNILMKNKFNQIFVL